MTIRLWDLDDEYDVSTDINAAGKEFVRINLGSSEPDYDICLDKSQCLELARVLAFIANEIKE